MVERIHLVLDRAEKERFRRLAERSGKSLSEWLREAACEKAAAASTAHGLDSEEDLRRFFEQADKRESGREPDWEFHRKLIEESIDSGSSE